MVNARCRLTRVIAKRAGERYEDPYIAGRALTRSRLRDMAMPLLQRDNKQERPSIVHGWPLLSVPRL